MHPALSIICFTALSGLGYGLAAVTGLGLLDTTAAEGRAAYVVALALIAGGLVCSTFHLGHPERAWRALTQWRSSWLSREGVLAIVTFVPLGLAAIGSVFLSQHWVLPALLAAVLSLVTVYSTSMIYASLKTVHQWHCAMTSVVFIGLSLSGGLLLASALAALFGDGGRTLAVSGAVLLGASLAAKLAWWKRAASETGPSTIESATGLGFLGPVRLLEHPHTEKNYLNREMGFRVARKHAARLRQIAIGLGFVLPIIALIVAMIAPSSGFAAAFLVLAVIAHGAGVLVERWLFFAEARHTVMLYYGDRTA